MSASPISPKVLSLLKKISQLSTDELCEVEHFIEFLVAKKEHNPHHGDMMPDTNDSSDTISEFIASFTASPISQPDTAPYASFDISEKETEQDTVIEEAFDVGNNHVIIAPEEPVCEKYPTDIDFADINARFAKKREERGWKKLKRSDVEELDWL